MDAQSYLVPANRLAWKTLVCETTEGNAMFISVSKPIADALHFDQLHLQFLAIWIKTSILGLVWCHVSCLSMLPRPEALCAESLDAI